MTTGSQVPFSFKAHPTLTSNLNATIPKYYLEPIVSHSQTNQYFSTCITLFLPSLAPTEKVAIMVTTVKIQPAIATVIVENVFYRKKDPLLTLCVT